MKNLIATAFVIFTTTSLFSQEFFINTSWISDTSVFIFKQVLSPLATTDFNVDSLVKNQPFLSSDTNKVTLEVPLPGNVGDTVKYTELKVDPVKYINRLVNFKSQYDDTAKYEISYTLNDFSEYEIDIAPYGSVEEVKIIDKSTNEYIKYIRIRFAKNSNNIISIYEEQY